MKEKEGNPIIYQLGSETMTKLLHKAGYDDIFHITSEGLTEFIKKNSTMPESDIKQIYESAKDRVENLQMLVMAWQLHNDPVTKNIKKLNADTGLKDLQQALERSLGSGADFNDLFPERSRQGYAELTSIQSLFSPGRYLAVLYKIAKQLIPANSNLNIDSRRPDLQSLTLSTANMNKEVSSLDILLDVLQANSSTTKVSLKDVYHPLTLPYDDHLVQINAVTESQGTSLFNIWDALLDTEKETFKSFNIFQSGRSNISEEDTFIQEIVPTVTKGSTKPNPVTRERLGLTPNSFRLLVNQNTTVQELAKHFGISSNNATDLARQLMPTDTFTRKTGLSINKLIKLTGQDIYSNNSQRWSRFIKLGSSQNSPVTEYGAKFLNSKELFPLWVNSEQRRLNFTASNVVNLGSKVEKLIRLSNSTGLSFEQLDWLIVNASDAMLEHGKEVILDSSVLTAIAEFIRLKDKYHITLDKYVTFFGKANLHAEVGKNSFYKSTFSIVDNSETIPLGSTIRFATSEQGLYESICCGALNVTADEFLRIGAYCFGNNVTTVTVNEETIARLYRLGKIPNMLGLTFTEAEKIWNIMAGGQDTFLRQIGEQSRDLRVLDIIRKTEILLNWMEDHHLDVFTLQAMLTDKFSGTATPELYNFLFKAYESSKGIQSKSSYYNKEVKYIKNLYRVLSTDFNLKTNVMIQVINWLEKTNTEFTFKKYWEKIERFFSIEHEEPLVALEQEENLVIWSQLISQYVLIAQWGGLNEQDLLLIVDNPEQLINGQNEVPKPSLYLLKILSRLKEWQQRVNVSADEAMRYLAQSNNKDMTIEKSIRLLSKIHGWNETFTASMIEYLYRNTRFPKNFEQVFTLERWVNIGEQLKIGSRTLGDLVTMAEENAVAENSNLIVSVAQNLMASVKGE